MALNVVNAKDIKTKPLTALLYAKPGVGKTYTLGQLKGKTVILDIDKTSGILKGNQNITILDVDVRNIINSMNEAIEWLVANVKEYDNVAIDNISELQSCILAEYGANGKNDGVPSQGDYQKYQFKLMNILRYFKSFNKNIVLTAWEELVTITSPSGEQYTSFMPRIQKTIRDNVCGLCDIVGHLEFIEDGSRGIRLETTKNVYAKNQYDDRKACRQNELILGGNK